MQTETITLAEYQRRAGETQTESARSAEYLMPGLIAEAGEIMGAYAKMIRDHGGQLTDAARELFKKEAGDVCWFIFREAERAGFSIADWDTDVSDQPAPLYELCRKLVQATLSYEESWRSDILRTSQDWLNTVTEMELQCIWFCTKRIIRACGLTVDEVLQANLEKLADRKRRGVISGSGDKR